MRPQTKLFTVEKKKNRKAKTEPRTAFAWVEASLTEDQIRRSPRAATADQFFKQIPKDERSSYSSRQIETGSKTSGEPGRVADRILPDLRALYPGREASEDRQSAGPKRVKRETPPKRAKVRRAGIDTNGKAVAADTPINNPVLAEPPAGDQQVRIDKLGEKANDATRRMFARADRLSPREIRRAVARGTPIGPHRGKNRTRRRKK